VAYEPAIFPQTPSDIVGIIRYSLVLDQGNFFPRHREKTAEDLRKEIFDPKRLSLRLELFREICLPSLQAQTDQNFNIVLIGSKEMPEEFQKGIRALVAPVPNVHTLFIASKANVKRSFKRAAFDVLDKNAPITASFRLDDDDAMSVDFISRLRAHMRPGNIGKVVSCTPGYIVDFTQAPPKLVADPRPKTGAGLAMVHGEVGARVRDVSTIYHLGAHRQVDKSAPLIKDTGSPAFFVTAHGTNASDRALLNVGEPVDAAALALKISDQFPSLTEERLGRIAQLCRQS
jgi:hypothetical protein